ncbi:ABC transporter permease [Streptococcaceae bacterium ESL0729]|nr:ABC transporter permease [Streptococcaceae bacterium ESL0729]
MKALMMRNLKLYFKEPLAIFFSLLSSLIILILYFAFLREGYLSNLSGLPGRDKFSDLWLLAGLLAVTGITVCFQSMAQLVIDHSSGKLQYFRLTDTRASAIYLGYFFSSFIIGSLMQILIYLISAGVFYIKDGLIPGVHNLLPLIIAILLNSLLSASLGLVITGLVKARSSLNSLGTIIGTLSGFLTGVYIPIGSLPNLGQNIIKLFPGAYSAALFREILLKDQLTDTFKQLPAAAQDSYREIFGIGLKLNGQLTTPLENILIILTSSIVLALLSIFIIRRTLKKGLD